MRNVGSPKLNDKKESATSTGLGKIEAIADNPQQPATVHVLLDDGRKMLLQEYLDHEEEYRAQQRPPLPVSNSFEGSVPVVVPPPEATDPMPNQQTISSGTLPIFHEDLGQWVRVFTDAKATEVWDFPLHFTNYLHDWFRKRPHLQLRFVVPFYREGKLIEMHAWYDGPRVPDKA